MFSRARSLAVLTAGVLLCTAISASAAFGSEFHFEKDAYLYGSSSAVFKFGPPKNVNEVKCPTFDLQNSSSGTKPTPKINLHPVTSSVCRWGTGPYAGSVVSFAIAPSCGFDLTLPSEGAVASMDFVGCGQESFIINGPASCQIDVTSQSGLSGVSLVNEGAGTKRALQAGFAVKNIKAKQTGGCLGGAGTFSTGEFTASPTLRGYVSYPNQQTGIWVE